MTVEQHKTNAVCKQGKSADSAHPLGGGHFLYHQLADGIGDNNKPEQQHKAAFEQSRSGTRATASVSTNSVSA